MEGTRIETRAGDDEVHADPEYQFPLANVTGFLSSEWGIKQGNFQEGASIGALVIDGGDGNDRLFGGFLGDTILGAPVRTSSPAVLETTSWMAAPAAI